MSTFQFPALRVDISRSDSTPSDIPLSFTPEIVRGTAAHGVPPQIDIAVQNISSNNCRYSTDYVPVFSGFTNENPPPHIFLVPSNIGAEYSTELRLVSGTFAPDAIQYEKNLSPGEKETNRYDIIDSEENDDVHYPSENYRFTQDVRVSVPDQRELSTFEWGFGLKISRK